jgi:hypothetical protein
MSNIHARIARGALIAGAVLVAAGPAFAERRGHMDNPNVVEVQPQTTLVPNTPDAAAPAASPVAAPQAAAPHQVTAAAPAGLSALLHQANMALKARHPAVARDRLEQAETRLLNARADGEQGFRIQVQDIAAARGALAGGDTAGAEREIGRILQAMHGAM